MRARQLAFAAVAACGCNTPVTFDDGTQIASGGSPGSRDAGITSATGGGPSRPTETAPSGGGTPASDDTPAGGRGGTPVAVADASPHGGQPAADAGAGRCRSRDDCPPGNICDPTGQCIDTCLNGMQCPSATPYCDARGVCVGCTQNSQCVSSPLGHVCNPANGECVECVTSAECAHTLPRCDAATNTCVRCLSNADCTSQHEWPICSSSGACIDT